MRPRGALNNCKTHHSVRLPARCYLALHLCSSAALLLRLPCNQRCQQLCLLYVPCAQEDTVLGTATLLCNAVLEDIAAGKVKAPNDASAREKQLQQLASPQTLADAEQSLDAFLNQLAGT